MAAVEEVLRAALASEQEGKPKRSAEFGKPPRQVDHQEDAFEPLKSTLPRRETFANGSSQALSGFFWKLWPPRMNMALCRAQDRTRALEAIAHSVDENQRRQVAGTCFGFGDPEHPLLIPSSDSDLNIPPLRPSLVGWRPSLVGWWGRRLLCRSEAHLEEVGGSCEGMVLALRVRAQHGPRHS